MKNLFKKAVSLTIAAGVVATLSVSAFAATATYYAEETKVDDVTYAAESVTLKDYTAVSGATQYAVAVVPEGFTGGDADIYYVNQYDAATIAGVIDMLLKEGLKDGNYEVRIGNNAAGTTKYDTIPFTVGKEEVTIVYGDVNENGKINNLDVRDLRRYLAKWTITINLDAADVNVNGKVNNLDVRDLRRHLAKWTGYETLPVK